MTANDHSSSSTTIVSHPRQQSPNFYPWLLNTVAIGAFGLGIFCCFLPGLQMLPREHELPILLAPLHFLGALHLGALFSIVWWSSLFTYPLGLLFLCGLGWLIALWGWLIRRVRSFWPRHRRKQPAWWLIPVLAWILSLLWATHLPLSISFALHRSQLADLASQVRTTPSGMLEFSPPKQVGLYPVQLVLRVSDRLVSIVLDGHQSLWAYNGFVYETSPQPGNFDPIQASLAPGSNNGDQDVLYLGDGWYAFQNLFD